MTTPTKYKDTFQSKAARLTWIILGQLIWIIPVLGGGYYVRENLPEWIDLYFGVTTAQKTAAALSARAELLSDPVIMNPSAIAAYIKAAFASMTAATKAYSLSSVAGITVSLGTMILNIGGIIVFIYGLMRIRKKYATQTHDTSLVNQICNEITPRLEIIQKEIRALAEKQNRL